MCALHAPSPGPGHRLGLRPYKSDLNARAPICQHRVANSCDKSESRLRQLDCGYRFEQGPTRG